MRMNTRNRADADPRGIAGRSAAARGTTVRTPAEGGKDPYDLERFIEAQDARHTFEGALAELREGRKVSHWMWFVFPQVAGLGQSPTSRRFAIGSLAEARAYVAHPVLGARLLQVSEVMVGAPGKSAGAVLGSIDAQKLRSSMTLFGLAAPDVDVFTRVLDRWFDGMTDEATLGLLARG